MKTIISKITLLFVIAFMAAQNSNAQFVIRVRPSAPRVVRVAAPSPRHVWIDEDWRWENGTYAYHGGYWAAPPPGRAYWVPGHWRNSRRGWIWKPGHWR